MATLFDRLNHELEAFGRRAQEVFDESRTRLELMRLRNLRDSAARDLGYLLYARERGTREVEQGRVDAALFKLDDLEHEIARLEETVARNAAPSAGAGPGAAAVTAPTDAPPGDAVAG